MKAALFLILVGVAISSGNKTNGQNSLSSIQSFVDVIGGPGKVDQIKKVFGFDAVKALRKLLDYENKTMVHTYKSDESNQNPEEKIGIIVKSTMTNLTDQDIVTLIEQHMLNLRLLTNTQPREWSHPLFETQLKHLFESGSSNFQSLNELVDTMVKNAAKNNYLYTFLSQLDVSKIKTLLENIESQGSMVLPDVVAYALVMENLNLEMTNDWKFLETCYKVWSNDSLRQHLTGFTAIKTSSIEKAVIELVELLKTNKTSDDYIFGKDVSFNIFQAMAQDLLEKKLDNALAGKTLALNPPGLEEDKQTKAGPTRISENGQMFEFRPPLPGLWADLYSTWNMAYITRFPDWPYYLMKLLIPSVSGYQDHPENYLYPRITALYAKAIHTININAKGGPKINWKNDEFTQTWGRFNRASAKDYEQQLKRVKSCGKNCG